MNHDLNVLLVRMEKVRGLGFISLVIKNREMTKTPFDFWFSRKDLQDWLLHACSAHNNEAFYYTNFRPALRYGLKTEAEKMITTSLFLNCSSTKHFQKTMLCTRSESTRPRF